MARTIVVRIMSDNKEFRIIASESRCRKLGSKNTRIVQFDGESEIKVQHTFGYEWITSDPMVLDSIGLVHQVELLSRVLGTAK